MRPIGTHHFSTKLAGTTCLFRRKLMSRPFSMCGLSTFLRDGSLFLRIHGREPAFAPVSHDHPLLCEKNYIYYLESARKSVPGKPGFQGISL
jgi:hypothetical protein